MIHRAETADAANRHPKADPKILDAPPAEPTTEDLDREGVDINNCRIMGCEHWNYQSDVPEWGTSTLAAHEHGVEFHHDFLLSLTDDDLHSIQWFRCPGCTQLYFSNGLLDDHKKDCPELKHAAIPRHTTAPYTSVVCECPPNMLATLIQMIDEPASPPDVEHLEFTVWKWSKANNTAGTHHNT